LTVKRNIRKSESWTSELVGGGLSSESKKRGTSQSRGKKTRRKYWGGYF